MILKDYERTQLIITEFSDDDVITTSGEVTVPLIEYEGRPIIED